MIKTMQNLNNKIMNKVIFNKRIIISNKKLIIKYRQIFTKRIKTIFLKMVNNTYLEKKLETYDLDSDEYNDIIL